jgi:hypothetical protein
MLGLADGFAEVGSIAPFLKQPQDDVDWIFVGHLCLQRLPMSSVEVNATRGQSADAAELPRVCGGLVE